MIDKNVMVSALLYSHADAATVQVVGKLLSGEVIPLFSEEILREYNEVLRRKKFKLSEALIVELLGELERCGTMVVTSPPEKLFPT